jgi:hypothetical protein
MVNLMDSSEVGPPKWYYGLGILVIVAGIALSASYLVSYLGGFGSELEQMLAPGSQDLTLSESGEYVVFYESPTMFQGIIYTTGEAIPGLQIEVWNRTRESKIPTYLPSASFTYTLGGRQGRSMLAFIIDSPGVYRINASYPAYFGGPHHQVVLAIGHDLMAGIFTGIFYIGAIFLGSMLLGLGVIIVTYMKRQKAMRLRTEEEALLRGK